MKRPIVIVLIVFSVVVLDQVTKYLILTNLPLHDSREVLPFLHIVHVRNTGAAFGMFKMLGNPFFVILSVCASLFVLYLFLRREYNRFGLSLILGGAIGNLIDRVSYGYVVDFIDIAVGSFHWPAFNVADSALTVGIAIILAAHFLKPRDANTARKIS